MCVDRFAFSATHPLVLRIVNEFTLRWRVGWLPTIFGDQPHGCRMMMYCVVFASSFLVALCSLIEPQSFETFINSTIVGRPPDHSTLHSLYKTQPTQTAERSRKSSLGKSTRN